MPQAMQGMIIGLLISVLVGIVIGFYLRQRRINELAAALKASQDRGQVLQREHEERLRTATAQLQQDYEAQLADKIERYQRQYEAQRQQLEAEYEARQNLMPGDIVQDPTAPSDTWDSAPVSEYEARLRQQYEARLKEAAHKIQQAYEQHLRATLATERDTQQQEYDQRLAEAIARYQDESDARLAAALQEQGLGVQAGGNRPGSGLVDETQVQERLATLEAELRSTYDRRLAERIEQYQDDMAQRMAQLEQEFAARLQMAQAAQPADLPPSLDLPANADLEARFQAEYDRRLAEAVARHQDELTERIQALTEDYEARLQMAQGGEASGETDGPEADGLDHEAALRQQLETELRAEYDLQLAEKLAQVQMDFDQRAQDFKDGLTTTMDPFVDAAVEAEALEDGGLDTDPFPDLGAAPAATAFADDATPTLGEPGADLGEAVALADSGLDSVDDGAFDPGAFDLGAFDLGAFDPGASDLGESADLGAFSQPDTVPDRFDEDPFGDDPFGDDPFGEDALDLDDSADSSALEDAGLADSTLEIPAPAPPETAMDGDDSTPGLDSAFNLDDLDLSALSDDDLALGDLDDEDIFNLETLAQKAGVDLGELNTLLNQTDPTTTEGDPSDFSDQDWENLN